MIADFNEDSLFDIGSINYGTHSVSIYYSHTNLELSDMYDMGMDSLPIAFVAADLNNDYCTDLAIANNATNNIYIIFRRCNEKTFDEEIIIMMDFNSFR